MDPIETEIVVVGSGPGGAITACILAEAGKQVTLVEEGSSFVENSVIPFSVREMEEKYRNGGLTLALGSPKINYVEGRALGGGSEINAGLYHRTPAEILEKWKIKYQTEALMEQDLISHFEVCEKDLSISLADRPFPIPSLKLNEGANKLGWKCTEVPRWFKKGIRQSMSETYLPRAVRAGCKVITNTWAISFRKNRERWSLRVRNDHSESQILAKTIFVCAGAIQTPSLLRRSGITHNVGNTLELHPTIKILAEFSEQVNFENMGIPVHQIKEFSPELSFGCSISSPPYLALGLLDHPDEERSLQELWKNMAIYYAMIKPSGKGSVRNIPGVKDPLVSFQVSVEDRKTLALGLKNLSKVLLEAGATTLFPSIYRYPPIHNPKDVLSIPDSIPNKNSSLMTIHLFSSCPMGENTKLCAVNSFGKVHGFQGLYVSDGSILCSAPSVNPQGSIMAIARRNAIAFLRNS